MCNSRKFAVVLLLLAQMLFACANAPDLPNVHSDEKLSHYATSQTHVATMDSTPLRDDVWMLRVGEARVPVLENGTTIDEVVAAVRRWGLEPLIGPKTIIVREGPSRSEWATSEPKYVVYGFSNDELVVGPLSLDEMVDVYVFWGLEFDDFHFVSSLSAIEPYSADALNNLAWAWATVHDKTKRIPHLAIRFAERSNAMTDGNDFDYLDTLAAAHAAAGQFDQAIENQRRALVLAGEADVNLSTRLALYEVGVPYIAPERQVSEVGVAFPRRIVFQRAEENDAFAQWELALFFLENEIDEHEGIKNPGAHYLKMASANDYLMAIEEIGFGYLHGKNQFPADIDLALEWLNKAAASGSDLAAYNLAMIYRNGMGGVDRNETLATTWLSTAAERGVAEAAVEVAYRYLEALGAGRDEALARRYFDIGAENDVSPEAAMFGDIHFSFEVSGGDESRNDLVPLPIVMDDFPRYWFAAAEDVKAQIKRGDPYLTVRFTESHYVWPAADGEELVFSLMYGAASYGSKLAQRALAKLYRAGIGTEVSKTEARYWRARARRNLSGL